MKLLLFTIIAVFVVAVSSATIEERWEQYKKDQSKSYDADENVRRFEIFKENVKKIEDHNAKYDKGEVSWSMGFNQFTDMEPKEYSTMYGGLRNPRIVQT